MWLRTFKRTDESKFLEEFVFAQPRFLRKLLYERVRVTQIAFEIKRIVYIATIYRFSQG